MADEPNIPQDKPQDIPQDKPQDKPEEKPSEPEKKEEKKEGIDPVKMAEELGSTKKENEVLAKYREQVDPLIQTITSDEELLKKVTEAHKKRLNSTETKETLKESNGEARDPEARNAIIKQTVDQFSRDKGIDKLEPEARKDMNVRISNMLLEMLDNTGTRSLQQVMESVSLTRLPDFLEKAYTLANKDSIVSKAKEEGKTEALNGQRGIVGSFSSSSIEPDNMSLTPKEKEIARKMGIAEDKFLARKKEIASRQNELY